MPPISDQPPRKGRRPPPGPGPPDLGMMPPDLSMLPPPPPGLRPPLGPGALPPPMMAGPGAPLPPGMTKPGQGMDAMAAMLGGLGLPPSDRAAPMGPGGLPFGANPRPKLDDMGNQLPIDTGGSDILSLLTGQAKAGDPYTLPPGATNQNLATGGPQDPQMGMEDMLALLSLIQMGAAGNPQAAGMAPGPLGGPGLPPGLF